MRDHSLVSEYMKIILLNIVNWRSIQDLHIAYKELEIMNIYACTFDRYSRGKYIYIFFLSFQFYRMSPKEHYISI